MIINGKNMAMGFFVAKEKGKPHFPCENDFIYSTFQP